MAKEYTRNLSAIGGCRPSGQILLFDDLEPATLRWINTTPPTVSVTRAQAAVYNGDFSLRFLGTGGILPRILSIAIERSFGLPLGSIFTVELVVAFWPGATDFLNFDIELDVNQNVRTLATLSHEVILGNVSVRTTGGGFIAIGNQALDRTAQRFHHYLLSCNTATGRYEHAEINSRSFSVAAIQLHQPAAISPSYSKILLRAGSEASVTPDMSIDDILVRQTALP